MMIAATVILSWHPCSVNHDRNTRPWISTAKPCNGQKIR